MSCIDCQNQISLPVPPYSTCRYLKLYRPGCITYKCRYKYYIDNKVERKYDNGRFRTTISYCVKRS